jgi:Cu(I)/Ag(I) efflux system membrane fusion protein
MTKRSIFTLLLTLSLGGIGGYWLARQQPVPETASSTAEHKPLFYRHPMNPTVTSPTPAKDEMGMDYLPVYAEDSTPSVAVKGKILYYRHPMGAADTSPVPKKDEMGMDYLPVYEGELANRGQLNLSPEKIQKLGVKSEIVQYRQLTRMIRALGTIQADERRLHVINAKFEGWVQQLLVNATGQSVKRGQALMQIYSPDLLTAQQEYLIARQGEQLLQQASPQALATAKLLSRNALQRLHYWDIGPAQLNRLQQQDSVLETLPLLSPVSGVVMEKPAVQGMRFMPGETLFQIADLSKVWLLVDVFEQDLDWIKLGQTVSVNIKAYPDNAFNGAVDFIYPTLNIDTRSVKVRVELDNSQGLLKPGLYGSVDLSASSQQHRELAAPESAILDSGTRQVALVQLAEGLFEPRKVKLGHRAGGFVEILEGLADGERVVTRANFLIDAESNLKAALDGMSKSDDAAIEEPDAMPEHQHHQQTGEH